MSKKKREESLNSVMRSIANPNKCISKMGVNISQFFVQLKVKDAGDISVINKHDHTQKLMQQENKFKEGPSQEGRSQEGRSQEGRSQEGKSQEGRSQEGRSQETRAGPEPNEKESS